MHELPHGIPFLQFGAATADGIAIDTPRAKIKAMITVPRMTLLLVRLSCALVGLSLSAALAIPACSASAADQMSLDGATVEACFTPGSDCASTVAEAVTSARQRVWLLGYGFSEPSILDALRIARERGLDVRVILDRSNDSGRYSGATYMAKVGVQVLIDRTVAIAHNKLILIDRDTVIMGSLNWTKAGNTKNAENVHIFRKARALAERHESYFRGREAVSIPYRSDFSRPQKR